MQEFFQYNMAHFLKFLHHIIPGNTWLTLHFDVVLDFWFCDTGIKLDNTTIVLNQIDIMGEDLEVGRVGFRSIVVELTGLEWILWHTNQPHAFSSHRFEHPIQFSS